MSEKAARSRKKCQPSSSVILILHNTSVRKEQLGFSEKSVPLTSPYSAFMHSIP
jgi:hypothetical protein